MRRDARLLMETLEAAYPGVKAEWQDSGRHQRLILNYAGKSRFVVCAATPSDHRDFQNTLRDARKELRRLGVAA